ncbi:MAG: CAP domain-containing protein [Methanospirillum sp.]|nr:CAP domain-containing protein [Methanospirillum sp.]
MTEERMTACSPVAGDRMRVYLGIHVLLLCLCISIVHAGAVAAGPDLLVTDIAGEQYAYPGYPYHVTVTLENHGDQASGLASLLLFLENTANPGNSTILGTEPVEPVRTGLSLQIPVTLTVPEILSPGDYSLYVRVKGHSGSDLNLTGNIARLLPPVILQEKQLPDQEVLNREIISLILNKTNENRRNAGVPDLVPDDTLSRIAGNYAKNLAETGSLSHIDRSGKDPAERARDAGYPVTKEIEGGIREGIGENLAYVGTGMVAGIGYVDPTSSEAISGAIINGWMKSPGHRKNILDPLADRFGVGLSWNGKYYYAVQEFW